MHLLTNSNLLNKGYHICTDYYDTKLPLAQRLLENNTYLNGTTNKHSKDLSKTVLATKLNLNVQFILEKRYT